MDIGEEKPAIVIEPLEVPVPDQTPAAPPEAPERDPEPSEQPVPDPEPLVPA